MNIQDISNSFSFERLLLLFKRTILLNRRNWLIGLSAIFGILLVFWLLPISTTTTPWHGYQVAILIPIGTILFIFGGFILTSQIFSELNSPSTSFLQLTLPATSFEKLICAWAISSIVYTIFFFTTFLLFINLVQFITNLFIDFENPLIGFGLFSHDVLIQISLYHIYHSAFLLGAVYFKKNNFFKTVLSIIITAIVVWIIMGIIFLTLASQSLVEGYIVLNEEPLYLIFQAVLAVLLLISAYISLRNRQIA